MVGAATAKLYDNRNMYGHVKHRIRVSEKSARLRHSKAADTKRKTHDRKNL